MTTSRPPHGRHRLEESLDRARQTGDAAQEAALLFQLGDLARAEKEYELAKGLYAQSWDAAQRNDDLGKQADVLATLVELYIWLSDGSDVLDQLTGQALCEEALTCYERLGDLQGQARMWIAKADLMREEDVTARLTLYEQALVVYENSQNLVMQAHALERVAWLSSHHVNRQKQQIQEMLERAVVLYEQAGDLAEAAKTLHELADRYLQDDIQIHYYQRAIAHYETLKWYQKVTFILERLGNIARSRHQYNLAAQYYERAIAIHEQHGENISDCAKVLYSLGQVSMILKDYKIARVSYLRALPLTHEGLWMRHADCLIDLAIIAVLSGDLKTGRAYAQRAFKLGESLPNAENLYQRLRMRLVWAEIEKVHKHPDQAREMLNAATSHAQKYSHGQRVLQKVRDDLAALDNTDPTAIGRFHSGK